MEELINNITKVPNTRLERLILSKYYYAFGRKCELSKAVREFINAEIIRRATEGIYIYNSIREQRKLNRGRIGIC